MLKEQIKHIFYLRKLELYLQYVVMFLSALDASFGSGTTIRAIVSVQSGPYHNCVVFFCMLSAFETISKNTHVIYRSFEGSWIDFIYENLDLCVLQISELWRGADDAVSIVLFLKYICQNGISWGFSYWFLTRGPVSIDLVAVSPLLLLVRLSFPTNGLSQTSWPLLSRVINDCKCFWW